MVFFNYALRKLNAKIVYYGPGLCGKTTNLQWIHDHFEGGQRGKMISLATEGDRTIFFDLLPIDIGTIRGMDVTLQLYTVPGQVHYNSTRQLVLRGADGVVFVADSQRTMRTSNAESFENLQENLMLQGIDLKGFPHILQFNKRDLRDLLSTEDLNESLNVFSCPIFEAIATEGIGVQESLEGIVKLVMRNLREKYEPVASAAGPQPLSPMQATGPMSSPPPAAPAATPPMPDVVARVEPAPDETRDVGPDSGFAAYQDEDGIATAVYESDDEEIAAHESALEKQFAGGETAPFAAAEDDPSFGPEAGKDDHFEGLFNDPRDEDGTTDVEKPLAATPAIDAVDREVGIADAEQVIQTIPEIEDAESEDELVTDPEIAAPGPESEETADETIDDLFEPEVPTVKAFMDDVAEVIEVEGAAGEDATPLTVDPPPMVVGPPSNDRYEDRIEAPGPFAPPPVSADEADEADEADVSDAFRADQDAEAVHAEVRHVLGASEDREALASLSSGQEVEFEAAIDGLDVPPEVQPVVPPLPEEPEEEEAPTFSVGVDDEMVSEPEFAAPEVTEPEFVEPIVEASESIDSIIVDFKDEEPVVEEPVAIEPPDSEPAVTESTPPPVAEVPTPKSRPIMFGVGDPFFTSDLDAVVPEVLPQPAAMAPMNNAIDVSAESNQLHLQLRGSGAIAEMGQVRALDIEVPVPGQWVGNQKVTLQLRLTLTPAEDEDD